MDDYTVIERIGEGAHGVVLKAKQNPTGKIVALKKVSLKKIEDGIPFKIIREIKALQFIDCPNVVKLLNVFPQGLGFVFVFEYMVTDLADMLLLTKGALPLECKKAYMHMLLKGTAYCHELGLIHRDLKPANLLISAKGILKIADFGLCRLHDKEQVDRPYSHQVATRWYRSPELLYGARKYNEGVDLWAIGCIIGELINNRPVFPGENDIDQLCVVLKALGSPNEESWPGHKDLPDFNKITFAAMKPKSFRELFPNACPEGLKLLEEILRYDENKRISAKMALQHEYFRVPPLPCHNSKLIVPKRRKAEYSEDLDVNFLDMF